MDEARLDAAYEPLSYIANGGQLRAYRGATIGAKRQFLINFWRQRDPDPATPRNEIREEFYGKIAYADNTFRERGSRTQSGWKTDRGRIYITFGKPDSVESHPSGGSYDRPSYEGGGSTTTHPIDENNQLAIQNRADRYRLPVIVPRPIFPDRQILLAAGVEVQ